MNYAEYESWMALNKHRLPADTQKKLEQGGGYIEFLFKWKELERIATPKMRALLYSQYPEFKNAHESYEPHFAKNIEHSIFELMEAMFVIIRKNREGISPEVALPKLYPHILKRKHQPHEPRGLAQTDKRWHAEMWDAFNAEQEFYKQFIDTLQDDVLKLLPELLNMAPEWWAAYVFYFRFQCQMWEHHNDRYSYLIKYGLTADWLEKDRKEVEAEIDRLEGD